MSTMRVPANSPLVNIPQDRGGGRRYNLNMGMVPQREAGSAMAFGGAAALGYGAMERGLHDVGRLLTGVSIDLQRRADETSALEAYNQLNERVGLFLNGDGSPDTGLYNRKGSAVVNSVKDTREFFNKNVSELAGGLTPNAAQVFQARADVLRFGEQRKVAVFESNGREKWQFDTYKATAETEMRASLDNFSTPRLRDESIARGMGMVEQMGLMNGAPPEAIENMLRKYRAEVMTAGARQLMDKGDFGGAMTAAMDPSLDEAQRLDLVQKAAAGSFNYKLGMLESGGDITGLRQAGAISADYTPAGFSTFKECLDPELMGIAEQEAEAWGVPPELVLSVMKCESGGNPGAGSSAGAIGLMQLLPGTAKDLGVNPHDPAQNIKGGVKYLRQMLDRYNGDTKLALMAYNWGMGNVDEFIKTGHGLKTEKNPTGEVPQETVDYLARNAGLLGMTDGNELTPAAPPPDIQPESLAGYGALDMGAQLQADVNLMAPADRVRAQTAVLNLTGAKVAEQLDGLVSSGELTETQALAQINSIENLALRKRTMTEYRTQSGIRRAMEKEQRMEFENDFANQLMALDGDMAAQWKLIDSLPAETKADRALKEKWQGVYAKTMEAMDPRYKGRSKGADPLAWGNVYDKILYGEITDSKTLMADENIAKLPMQDVQFFVKTLAGSQQVDMAAAHKGFARALGEINGEPGKDKISSKDDKAAFAAFYPFAQQMAAQTNRGQDEEYYYNLGKMFQAKGERNHEGIHLWGYGDNATMQEAFEKDGGISGFLPHFDALGVDEDEAMVAFASQPESTRQKYLKQYDADDVEDQEEWAARAWIRDQMMGPRQRAAQSQMKAKDVIPEKDYKDLKQMFDNNQDLVYAYMDSHEDKSFDAMMLWGYAQMLGQQRNKNGS